MKKNVCFFIMMILLNIVNPMWAYCEPTIKNHSFDQDIKINRTFGEHKSFFYVDKYWNLKKSYIELIFSQSEINVNEHSTITIYINNTPIYSTGLRDKGVNRDRIKVFIPETLMKEGYNELSIKTYHRISDLPCMDDINPANWILFHKESYIHLEYEEKIDSNMLKDYPYPYLKESEELPSSTVIVVPDQASSNELKVAMLLAANFGQRRKFTNMNINIYKYSDKIIKKKRNIIFIGSSKNLPSEVFSILSRDESNTISNEGLIKEIRSPYDENFRMLLILSDHNENLLNAAKILSKDDLISQMDQSTQVVSKNIEFTEERKKEKNNIVLKELAYESVLLEGLFENQATFGINIPKNWEMGEGTKLNIKMRYSKVLDFEKSSMTIFINGTPIGSHKMKAEKADEDEIEIDIPKDVKESNYYELKIVYNLMQGDKFCEIRPNKGVWAFISNESYLYLPHNDKKDALFENYPNPFIKDYQLNNVLLILSNNPSSKEMSIAGNIIAFLGHEADSISGLEVITARDFSDKHKNKEIIMIGTHDKNNMIKSINKDLHIKFNERFDRFVSNEKIAILNSSNLASMQFIKSPYNKDKKILVVTATNQEGLEWAKKYLSDFQLIQKIKGNAVIINKSGDTYSKYYGVVDQTKTIEEKKSNGEKIIYSAQIRNYIIFIVSILLFIVVTLVVLIRKHKK
ncbi:cellulose biosynthesis cyclic di-GMP-binding regulatory protein BcsB [Lutibacter sp. B2]|nr:cellulose biosynthesis cyclic di-GMP-binding regulatory protein BcsB [Lutibacter sp. B2]